MLDWFLLVDFWFSVLVCGLCDMLVWAGLWLLPLTICVVMVLRVCGSWFEWLVIECGCWLGFIGF